MFSSAVLVAGAVIALWFVVRVWELLGAIAGVETVVVSAVVVIGVAALYGLLPPLFGLMATSSSVIVIGAISYVLLRVLF